MQRHSLSASDVIRVVGEDAADRVTAILALEPTLQDLEEAMTWVEGDGDILGKQSHPLAGKAAAVFEILQADAFDEEP
jgi:hypothetical protein